MRTCYQAWFTYYVWCRRFNNMHARACLKLTSRVFLRLRLYSQLYDHVRTCWAKMRFRKKASVFHSLRLNVVLSQHMTALANRQVR